MEGRGWGVFIPVALVTPDPSYERRAYGDICWCVKYLKSSKPENLSSLHMMVSKCFWRILNCDIMFCRPVFSVFFFIMRFRISSNIASSKVSFCLSYTVYTITSIWLATQGARQQLPWHWLSLLHYSRFSTLKYQRCCQNSRESVNISEILQGRQK